MDNGNLNSNHAEILGPPQDHSAE